MMADTNDEKRRAALQRMRENRGKPEARPQQTLSQPAAPAQAGGAGAGAQGARLRELIARRAGGGGLGGGAAAGGAAAGAGGARLRELIAKRAAGGGLGGAAAGGANGGGRLRDILAKRAGAGAAPAAAAPTAAAAPAAGAGAAANRPFLRKILAQRGAGAAPAAAAPVATDPVPEESRARLRERIGKLQARLDELDRAAATSADGVEDATVIDETPGDTSAS